MSHLQFRKPGARTADKHSSNERGQSAVLITLLFVSVVAMLGLVLDGGNAYLQRRRMQNAADGAAFAGAIKLANPGTLTGRNLECAIRFEIEKFATSNGASGPTPAPNCGTNNTNVIAQFIDENANPLGYIGAVGSVPSGSKGVSVTVKSTFNTFFLGVVNVSNGAANAGAKASFAFLQAPEDVQPLSIPCNRTALRDCFTFNQRYDIYEGAGSGSFGWLSWNGQTDAGYVEEMLNPSLNMSRGYTDPKGICPAGGLAASNNGVPCWVRGLTGVTNSSGNKTQLDAWKVRGAAGKPMIIIVYDTSEGSGSNTVYRIKGFAAFVLEDYNLSSKWIRGRFIEYTVPGKLCTSSCFDTGLTGLHLRP
jgi:hypothetical protein